MMKTSLFGVAGACLPLLVSCTPAAPETPDPSSAPSSGGSVVEMLSSAEQSCEAAQRSGIPVHCHMGVLEGTPAVLMDFATRDEADKDLDVMTRRVGKPFCGEASGSPSRAGAIIVVEDQYRSFDCVKRGWSEWARARDAGAGDVAAPAAPPG